MSKSKSEAAAGYMQESEDHSKMAASATLNSGDERLHMDLALLKSNWAIFLQLQILTAAVRDSTGERRYAE